MMFFRWLVFLSGLLGAMASLQADETSAEVVLVKEKNSSYGPDLELKVGQTVRILNAERTRHVTNVKYYAQAGATPEIVVKNHHDHPGKAFDFKLDRPGLYRVQCLLHLPMRMNIRVEAVSP
ncbi:MAG: hypothetical protein D6698_02625 [Gammaproteobacteria bacterium]|nr:MAG: hypothetical protein D6698_02625 [Gammaproteobacteria bacterium]